MQKFLFPLIFSQVLLIFTVLKFCKSCKPIWNIKILFCNFHIIYLLEIGCFLIRLLCHLFTYWQSVCNFCNQYHNHFLLNGTSYIFECLSSLIMCLRFQSPNILIKVAKWNGIFLIIFRFFIWWNYTLIVCKFLFLVVWKLMCLYFTFSCGS